MAWEAEKTRPDERSVYVTTADIGFETGGGNVSFNECLALKSCTNLRLILGRSCVEPSPAPFRCINPVTRSQQDSPFLWDYFAYQELKQLREFIDLIHFNGNPFGVTVEMIQRSSLWNTKVFVTVPAHNLEESIMEHNLLGMAYRHPHMTDPYLWDIYTRHIRLADVVVCPSKMSADYITEKLSLQRREVVVIRHGADPPKEVPPYPDVFTVGHLGVNGADKGQLYLVKAWNMLSPVKAQIMIAGEGTENWGGLGRVEDASQVYRGCTVYVQPSVTEGFGLPTLEAMGYARPVIVTRGCGAADLVTDGKEGFVVRTRNPDDIAEKIRYFYDNPSEVQRMGKEARATAERHTWEKVRKDYEALYREHLK